ncbi:hypothetical protein ORV05_09950 [Amycolatopsis cynarae]|uniref:Uncharacterized protein n=1 Tax=Amycolatopsis cynarae TaxID=2995223 RepID=A0ABY7BA13_9PSEU|nr:hypothetical protein [Amycolatopsis sp. HUAS 11-8]WAL68062.1 hypothetical protein ORV05_09950 [Amycolatopsis sp. HUAS 11-8]
MTEDPLQAKPDGDLAGQSQPVALDPDDEPRPLETADEPVEADVADVVDQRTAVRLAEDEPWP